MIISVVLYFGGNYGPKSWEPIVQICFFLGLAQWMYNHTIHKEKMNKEAINLMTLPNKNDTTKFCIIYPIFNNINVTVNKQEGDFVLEFNTVYL